MAGQQSCMRSRVLFRLTFTCLSSSSSDISSQCLRNCTLALVTKISTSPVFLCKECVAFLSERSAVTAPKAPISFLILSAFSISAEQCTKTRAPASTNALAMAYPMPWVEPVTRAVLPFRSNIVMIIPFCAKLPFAAVCLRQIRAILYGTEATKGGGENLFSTFLYTVTVK